MTASPEAKFAPIGALRGGLAALVVVGGWMGIWASRSATRTVRLTAA